MNTFRLTIGKESGWITFAGPAAATGAGKLQTQEQAQQARRSQPSVTTQDAETEEPTP